MLTCIIFFQGCGLRTFPIGGVLEAPGLVTGIPTIAATLNNALYVSKLLRLVSVFLHQEYLMKPF